MGRGLSRRLERLFHLGAYGDDRPPPRPASGEPSEEGAQYLTDFKLIYEIEDLHALEGRDFRRKRRRARRRRFRREPALTFYPRHVAGSAAKVLRYLRGYLRAKVLTRRILADPERFDYTDVALQPPTADEFDSLDLFQETGGGTAAVAKKIRQDAMIEGARA